MKRFALVVIGAGPGGYTAAFRAADLGLEVCLIERHKNLGGVCLNVGCIPSKAFLHASKLIHETSQAHKIGLTFAQLKIDHEKLASWKGSVVKRLTTGLKGLAKQRKVTVIYDHAELLDANTLKLSQSEESIGFDQLIIACGSRPSSIPNTEVDNELIWNSTGALKMRDVPKSLLIVGGGIIGMELAQVYHALGSRIEIVELTDNLFAELDRDLANILIKRAKTDYAHIMTRASVTAIKKKKSGCTVTIKHASGEALTRDYERVLIATGRTPNNDHLNLNAAGIQTNKQGFIEVDDSMRTNLGHIFAIGDAVGQPMLAHKATHQGKVAAECVAGEKAAMNGRVIPSVAYTDPEVAWVGMTEEQAKEQGIDYEVGSFPWQASGRALAQLAPEGLTKIIADTKSKLILGGGCAGYGAGELIAEIALAIEMRADCEDIGLTVHPHPTLSETVAMACETITGSLTDLYVPKKKK